MICGSDGPRLADEIISFYIDASRCPELANPQITSRHEWLESSVEKINLRRRYLKLFLPPMKSVTTIIRHSLSYVCSLVSHEDRITYHMVEQRIGSEEKSGMFGAKLFSSIVGSLHSPL